MAQNNCYLILLWCGQGETAIDSRRRYNLAIVAVCMGEVECLEVILKLPFRRCGSLCAQAAYCGHLGCLELAYQHGDYLFSTVLMAATQGRG